MTMSSTAMTSRSSLEIVEVKPGVKFSLGVLRELLPSAETVLFFGKVYELDYIQLSSLMSQVLQSELATELFAGDHSTDLQDYLIGDYDEDGEWVDGIVPSAQRGEVTLSPDVPTGEILPEVWKSMQVDIAKSIKDVAAKLQDVIGMMPGKQGSMVFKSMMTMNAKRPTLGDYRAKIHHPRQKPNLLILDDSGSVTAHTIGVILEDVVAMAYMADAHLAVVSDTTRHWDPGTFDVDSVLREGQYGGTQYETLADLLQQDWGVVITIADYDSSASAKKHIASKCKGRIDQVLDISLVNRPSFLAECVGQLANEVRPLLVANSTYVIQ
jgi:hypothetical protein